MKKKTNERLGKAADIAIAAAITAVIITAAVFAASAICDKVMKDSMEHREAPAPTHYSKGRFMNLA